MPGSFDRVRYTDDCGNFYQMRMLHRIYAQGESGGHTVGDGSGAVASDRVWPQSWRPRVGLFINTAARALRRVVCLTNDAAAYCGGGATAVTVTLKAAQTGADVIYTWYGHEGEKILSPIQNTYTA